LQRGKGAGDWGIAAHEVQYQKTHRKVCCQSERIRDIKGPGNKQNHRLQKAKWEADWKVTFIAGNEEAIDDPSQSSFREIN
jgi:hypothetical protein